MKQIVLFVESKLLSFQKTRLGLDYYLKKRLNVRIFNISPIVRPEYFKKYFPTNRIKFPKEEILENKIQILDAIKKFDSKTFVFLHITDNS